MDYVRHNLILGLLEPDIGSLEVDGVTIDSSNRSQWLSAIGYVPQHIFLVHDIAGIKCSPVSSL